MNSYYQIDEEPRRRSRVWIAVTVVAAAVLAAAVAVASAFMRPAKPPVRVPPEEEASSSEVSPGESGSAWWEIDTVAEVGSDEGFRPISGQSVVYYPQEVIADREKDIYTGLKAVAEARWDVLEAGGAQVGLFDLYMDGLPEIVLISHSFSPETMTDYTYVEVFLYDGTPIDIYNFRGGAEISLLMRAATGRCYPCEACLTEGYSVRSTKDVTDGETVYTFEAGSLSLMYSYQFSGERAEHFWGADPIDEGRWQEKVAQFEQMNPRLENTWMRTEPWDTQTDIWVLASTLLQSEQQYVMPMSKPYIGTEGGR